MASSLLNGAYAAFLTWKLPAKVPRPVNLNCMHHQAICLCTLCFGYWVLGSADNKWGSVGLLNMEAIIPVLAAALFAGLYFFVNRRNPAPQPSPVY
jgi:hypothetical protein